jgi:hypothetical protein
MSLVVAIPCALAAALAYGAATAAEHSAANTGTGRADASGLLALLRNPRWLAGMAGDTVGLVLQVVALSTGPVVLIQPLLVLALPVSLPIGWLIGGPRPRRADYLSCAWIIAGLGVFFAVIGDPGSGDLLRSRPALVTVILAIALGGLAILVVLRRAAPIRALIYGAVSGAWFGVVAVLLDATSTLWREQGVRAFGHPVGLIPLIGLLVLGGLSIVLTQIALQVGELGASFPANLSADPVVAVILGAALLHENLPMSVPLALVYAVALAAVVYGAVRLANPHRPVEVS